jgi:hypothetical protein
MKTRALTLVFTAAVLALLTQCGNDNNTDNEGNPAEQSIDNTSGGREPDGTYQEEFDETDSTNNNNDSM